MRIVRLSRLRTGRAGELFHHVFDVAWVVLKNLLPQSGGAEVCVNFGCADVLVSEHGLDGSQVGAPFEKGSGEGMAQGVGADGLFDARQGGLAFYHDEYHGACKVGASAVEEDIVFFARLDVELGAAGKPVIELADGTRGDGHQTLFCPLAEHTHKLLVDKKTGQAQVDQLAHSQSAGIQHLDDGSVAVAFGLGQVDGLLQPVNLFGCEHRGEVFARLRPFQELGGVVVAVAVEYKVAEEAAHAAQYAALRRRADADVVQACRKLLQVLQPNVEHAATSAGCEDEQFFEVTVVGIERMWRHVALKFEIAHVSTNDIK